MSSHSEMEITDDNRPAWISLILMFMTAMMGFIVIGPLIGFFLAIPFFEGNILDLPAQMADPAGHPELRLPLFIMQGCATLIGLIIIPALYIKAIVRKSPSVLLKPAPLLARTLLIAGLIVMCFMVANSFFIEWNANLKLPEALKGLESWAREREDMATRLTEFMTTFGSPAEFAIAFIVVAVLPGIGEELVFRGMLQPELFRTTKNIHVAIWLSAILFSAIHMQFFGFVPRVLLGVLFGYLFYWTGNIMVSMFAHFVNNGFSVVMLYLNQRGIIEVNPESTEAAPLPLVLVFTLITFALMLYVKRMYQPTSPRL